jgi:hypothetical protein
MESPEGTDWQVLVVYLLVFATLVAFAVAAFRAWKKGSCGESCGCGKVRRHPLVQKLVERKRD